jgi:hypothetical protein
LMKLSGDRSKDLHLEEEIKNPRVKGSKDDWLWLYEQILMEIY